MGSREEIDMNKRLGSEIITFEGKGAQESARFDPSKKTFDQSMPLEK